MQTSRTGIDGALVHLDDLLIGFASKHAMRASQHDGHPANKHVSSRDDLLAACKLDVDVLHRRRVSKQRQPERDARTRTMGAE